MRRPTCVEFSGFLLLFIVEPRTKNGAKNKTPSYSAVNDGTKMGTGGLNKEGHMDQLYKSSSLNSISRPI
jgi:hypothetical protein